MSKFEILLKLYVVCEKCNPQSESLDVILGYMEESAKTFDDWRNIFYRSELVSPTRIMALLQMATCAKTFGQWLSVYCEACDQQTKQIAMNQLMELADNPKDSLSETFPVSRPDCLKLPRWQKIFDVCEPGSPEEEKAAMRILKFAQDRKQRYIHKPSFEKI